MSIIVNPRGSVYKRIAINYRGYDEYEEIEDIPPLLYNKNINQVIGITEQNGRLYDIERKKYIDTVEMGFKTVIIHQYGIYALKDNGDLYLRDIIT